MIARVLITEAVNAPLTELAGLDVDERIGLWRDDAALAQAVRDCAGLIVRNQTRVDATLLANADNLRVVGRLGAGLDNVDVEALRSRSIALVHGGGLNARAVAEYVIGCCAALARGVVRSDREVRAGEWKRHVGIQLEGQTIGVIGLGATGAATAKLAASMGMRVLGYDPYLHPPAGVERLELAALLALSRFLTVHVPLDATTRGLVSSDELAMMPRGGFVVNASRGGIIDEEALLAALDSGHIAGAALDVRPTEPPGAGDPLAGRDDVILTAHIAGLTEESQAAIATHVLSGVRAALAGPD